MIDVCLVTPESTLYREVDGELVVIQLDSGHFYYFSSETKLMLDFFRKPRKLSTFLERAALNEAEKGQPIKQLCEFLLAEKILVYSEEQEQPVDIFDYSGELPRFKRKGNCTLDELTFLCP